MRTCRHTELPCTNPHLLCRACPVAKRAAEESREALVPKRRLPELPDPRPYVRIGSPSGSPGFGIEIGIKGTF